MLRFDLQLACPLHRSARTREVERMFDMDGSAQRVQKVHATLPGLDEPWQIGVIVGRSGSGKSTIARAAYKEYLHRPRPWQRDRAVIDCFGLLPTAAIVRAFNAVGFSSPPAWLKPFAVLSTGEQFRCELARALLRDEPLVVVDEFTSVVDRNVARICAAAVSRAVRAGWFARSADRVATEGLRYSGTMKAAALVPQLLSRDAQRSASSGLGNGPQGSPPSASLDALRCTSRLSERSAHLDEQMDRQRTLKRFVAVTCHRDIVPWLEADWVLDMDTGLLARGRLRRPTVALRIAPQTTQAWELFKRHHYLSANLHRSARCFLGTVDGAPAVFSAVLAFPHPTRPGWREHRMVCLPDFQGIGLGNAMSEFVASLYVASGRPYFSTTSHPAMLAHRSRSPLWRMTRRPGVVHAGGATSATPGMTRRLSLARVTAGFEYIGPARPEVAERFGLHRINQRPARGV